MWICAKGRLEMASAFKQDYIDLMKHLLLRGWDAGGGTGLCGYRDFNEDREIQQRIMSAYEQDFPNTHPYDGRTPYRMLWNSIPAHWPRKTKSLSMA